MDTIFPLPGRPLEPLHRGSRNTGVPLAPRYPPGPPPDNLRFSPIHLDWVFLIFFGCRCAILLSVVHDGIDMAAGLMFPGC
jgi:hypothetical protein